MKVKSILWVMRLQDGRRPSKPKSRKKGKPVKFTNAQVEAMKQAWHEGTGDFLLQRIATQFSITEAYLRKILFEGIRDSKKEWRKP